MLLKRNMYSTDLFNGLMTEKDSFYPSSLRIEAIALVLELVTLALTAENFISLIVNDTSGKLTQ